MFFSKVCFSRSVSKLFGTAASVHDTAKAFMVIFTTSTKTSEVPYTEAATEGVLCKKLFLEISQNSQEKTCARVSFLMKFIKKETLAQVFSYEFCEIFKNTFFTEHF